MRTMKCIPKQIVVDVCIIKNRVIIILYIFYFNKGNLLRDIFQDIIRYVCSIFLEKI